MKLSDLIGGNGGARRIDIAGLSADSRNVAPGYLFAALSGTEDDGAAFIGDAVKHGAVAVLARPEVALEQPGVHLIHDVNPRRRFSQLAARFFPQQPRISVAVTGTNGKTSVAHFTRQIWEYMGLKAASMGTLGVTGGGFEEPGSLTTPDPVKLHKSLDALACAGVNHLAMEASSHGLEQHRLDGVKLTAAAFTNLTRDHLDYHGDAESYLYAKMRLFGEILRPGRSVVLNADDCEALRDVEDLCWARGLRILTVGRAGDLRLEASAPSPRGQRLSVIFEGQRHEINLPLIGGFQAMNALMAAGLAMVCGAEPAMAFAALEHLVGVPGRLELVGHNKAGAPVFVDYAHTPDGLANVLAALRPHCSGKLGVVFGCGGDRDAGKRPQMGAIAARMADRLWVTDDNPRSEDAAAIRRAIMAACPGACEIGDRGEAIACAVESLAAGDVLVIAGKGHEQGQIVGNQVLPFDDVAQVRGALARLDDREGG